MNEEHQFFVIIHPRHDTNSVFCWLWIGLNASNMSDEEMVPEASDAEPAEEEIQAEEYDNDLTTEHTYLGRDLETLTGRTFTEDGSIQSMLVFQELPMLIPGETLPLKFYHPGKIKLLSNVIKRKQLFGVLHPGQKQYGTTAEIRNYKLVVQGSAEPRPCLTVIAEGIKQFQLMEELLRHQLRFVKVQILKDVTLQSPEKRLLLERQRDRGLMTTCSPWPRFLYNQFDKKYLVQKVSEAIAPFVKKIPPCTDPVKFSYWAAANSPVNSHERRLLLAASCTQDRLRMALVYLSLNCDICCKGCHEVISSKAYIISMSRSGAQGTFVNRVGYVHNLLTVGQIRRIIYQGARDESFSWYPGYAWTIGNCSECHRHLGWKFDTVKHLKPATFWALSRENIEFRVLMTQDRLTAAQETAELFAEQENDEDADDQGALHENLYWF
ncbi:protein cereblon-like isoform X2 [Varroa destructor]|uniref:Protein cereblon n=1 Tax=Varroa destructor TaxID=109461 RepID=A0A7M7JHD3_VARDE|nr:protein cereblon-like isoform X2 [Varroa destructor]